MTARARRAPRLAPAQTLELLPPVRAEPPLVEAEPAPAVDSQPPARARNFEADSEAITIDENTYVEREYRAGYHDYSLWEEGRDGYGYHRETIRRSVRWGRVDTRYSYTAKFTTDQFVEALEAELKHLREVEDKIVATCPELEPLVDRGPLYRSRGRVRLGGDPRDRYSLGLTERAKRRPA